MGEEQKAKFNDYEVDSVVFSQGTGAPLPTVPLPTVPSQSLPSQGKQALRKFSIPQPLTGNPSLCGSVLARDGPRGGEEQARSTRGPRPLTVHYPVRGVDGHDDRAARRAEGAKKYAQTGIDTLLEIVHEVLHENSELRAENDQLRERVAVLERLHGKAREQNDIGAMNPEKHPASGDTRRMPERPGGDLLGKQGAGNEKLAKPMQTESMGNANSGHNTRQGHGHGNGNGARGGGDSGGMAKQTDSVGHAVVDKPMIQLHKEKLEGGGGGGGGEGEWSETSRLLQEETGRGRTGSGGRASRGGGAGGGARGGGTGGRGGGRNHGQSDIKVLVPADCGNFLADHISTSDISPLLMDLGLSYVQVEDLRSKHQLNLREMRVEGIIAALLKLPHNEQLPGLIGALINRGLRRQAELFCEHFGLDLVLISDQCRGPSSNSQRVAAALPVRTPQNHLEKALQPFLQDAHNLPALTCQVRKGPAISLDKLSQFKEVFQLWRERDIDMFNREVTDCVAPHFKEELGGSNLRLFRVLDAWAAVELERSSLRGGITERDVEYLAKACRKIKVYHILRKHLKDGVAGPAIARQTYLRAIPFTLKNQLVQELDVKRGDGKDWRALAQFVGYNDKIRLWQQKDSPAELVWETWKTRNVATVGALYDWAVNNERTDLAAVLEAE